MATSIRVYSTSADSEKIRTVISWIKKTHIRHKDRLLSFVTVPRDLRLTPTEIAEYASAINSVLLDERVTDYYLHSFTTVKKEAFPKVCFNNDFNAESYIMELDKLGWHIVPDRK